MKGLQVKGGDDGGQDPVSASQRPQAEEEGDAGAAAVASMLLFSPTLVNQVSFVVLLQIDPGSRKRSKMLRENGKTFE